VGVADKGGEQVLDDDLLGTVADGLMYGDYSLLLGAGASVGSTGGNGRPLPTGPGLRDALIRDFGIDVGGEEISLARVYEECTRRDLTRLTEYVVSWFTNCRPTWQGVLAEFTWRRIWTLSIDDVVERAMRDSGRPHLSLGWRERFVDRSTSVQIVHLHGKASDLGEDGHSNEPMPLVFSLMEYARVVGDPRSWHKVFLDEIVDRPFVVIGARLAEEFDLVEGLQRGSGKSGSPSIVVLPSFTALQLSELQDWGFKPVVSTGQHFFQELLPKYRAALSRVRGVYGDAAAPWAARFLEYFRDPRTVCEEGGDPSRFYSGYKPGWFTIEREDDAELEATARFSSSVCEGAAGDTVDQEIHVLHGEAGSGKSTALLRLGGELLSEGLRTFLFCGEEDFRVDDVVRWLRNVPRSVLLLDDCADFAGSLESLARECAAANVRLVVAATERTSRLRFVKDRISERFLHPDWLCDMGRLSDEDIRNLIDKLDTRGRLGKITRLPYVEQQAYFAKEASRRLFEAMAGLEGGEGFRDRIRKRYGLIANEKYRDACVAASISYELGITLSLGLAADSAGVAPRDVVGMVRGDSSDLLLVTRNGVRPPHRITASLIMAYAVAPDHRFRVSLSLMKALAPHLDLQAIVTMTRAYRLARQLMDWETVFRLAGTGRAREWYDSLRADLDWNGRYWEQRALMESQLGEHAVARSYAERSVRIHPHPFAFNTLGTVLIRIAVETGDIDTLRAAVTSLREARNFGAWKPMDHPYMTFFSGMLSFGRQWGVWQIPYDLRRMWPEWHKSAAGLPTFSHPDRVEQLRRWNSEWLIVGATGRGEPGQP
jgi:hypothetical protein